MSLVEKLFGSFSDRELKKINPIAKQVLALEGKYAAMPDADLQAQTAVFKQQLADGKTTDDILGRSSAALPCTAAIFPRCRPVKARLLWLPCPPT